MPGIRADASRRTHRPRTGEGPRRRDVGQVRVRHRPRRPRRGPAGRRPAAGRDRQGPLQGSEDPRPRRADRRAHPAGDRRAHARHEGAGGRGHLHRLHHPQAPRGPGRRRRDHRHPPRQGGRARLRRLQPRGARHDDGRPPRHAARRERARCARRGRPRTGRRLTSLPDGRPAPGARRTGGAQRRDPGGGGRAGQRPDRARRGRHGLDGAELGNGAHRRQGRHEVERAPPHRRRRGLRPRGPFRRRHGGGLLGGGEPGAQPVSPQTLLQRPVPLARQSPRRRRQARRGVRRAAEPDDRPDLHALGGQPAESGRRPRALARPVAPPRQPADPRRGRRLRRVHPQAHRRRARCGHARAARLLRARRGGRAVGPDRRDVPRPDPRRRPRRHTPRRARPDDGGPDARRSPAGRAGGGRRRFHT